LRERAGVRVLGWGALLLRRGLFDPRGRGLFLDDLDRVLAVGLALVTLSGRRDHLAVARLEPPAVLLAGIHVDLERRAGRRVGGRVSPQYHQTANRHTEPCPASRRHRSALRGFACEGRGEREPDRPPDLPRSAIPA